MPWYNSSATITENIFSIKEKGFFYEVNLYLSFKATNPDEFQFTSQIELVSQFNLPEDYVVSNLWLWVGDQIMEARIYDKWTAQRIYDDIVIVRRKDPAILIKRNSRSYVLRIYPFRPDQERKIRLSFLIPQNRNQNNVQIHLPDYIQQLAEHISVNPKIIYWSDETDPDIQINGYESLEFENDLTNGEQYWSAEIPITNNDEDLVMSRPSNQDSTKILIYNHGDDKYYNLSFFPADIIESDRSTHALILINFSLDNLGKKDVILSTLKSEMKAQYGPEDKFNIMISDIQAHAISDHWLTASDSVIDSAFNSIDLEEMENFANLDNLLTEGVQFLRDNKNGSDILLISTSREYDSIKKANNLLDAFYNYLGDDNISISVADLRENYAGSDSYLVYYGNEYLYDYLTKDTGGDFFSLFRTGTSMSAIIQSGLGTFKSGISSADTRLKVSDGFTYGNYSNLDNIDRVYLDNNINQVGKFVGEPPFTVELTGFYEDSVFYDEVTITSDQIGSTDSTLKKYWSAKRINELESGGPNNTEITEIIDLSKDNRILSRYTAFLALEPSDTVKACASCFDESELVSNEDDLLPDSFEVDSLAAYPNPFNPAVNIQVNLAKAWDASNSSLEIFNILGQSVAKLNTENFNGQKSFQVRWNVQDSGSISSGVYIVRLRTPNSLKTMKITYMK